MVEMSRAVGPWREAVRAETQLAMPGAPMTGPVNVHIIFYLPRPKNHYRTGRNAHILHAAAPRFPQGRPDIDKLARAVLDGMTTGGAWSDDSQVVSLSVHKLYTIDGEKPGCVVDMEKL
jgi:Holliday junction resolvase RusA-like endonuclease